MRLTSCELCPHECEVNRTADETGRCGSGSKPVIFRYGPHHGEEPPVSGTRGSGTLFFSHCTLSCLYCQNFPWSQQHEGDVYDEPALVQALCELADAGCHNWNLVSPTPWLPWIESAVSSVRDSGRHLPVVFNTSGYELEGTLERYGETLGQIYITDLRYACSDTASTASGASDYPEVARRALRRMWEQRGPLQIDENGVALCGVICRLLILPGRAEEVVASLGWLADTVGTEISISVMAQYRPAYQAVAGGGDWSRGISRQEYDMVCDAVDDFGFENGWVQAFSDSTADELIGHQMTRGGFLTDATNN